MSGAVADAAETADIASGATGSKGKKAKQADRMKLGIGRSKAREGSGQWNPRDRRRRGGWPIHLRHDYLVYIIISSTCHLVQCFFSSITLMNAFGCEPVSLCMTMEKMMPFMHSNGGS